MSSSVIRKVLIVGAAAMIGTASALAHHSFAAEFDRNQPFEIEGAVISVDWRNPHGWIHVDVEQDGEMVTYDIELSSPSMLMRQGWRRDDVLPGDRILVRGFRARTRFTAGRATVILRDTGEAIYGMGIDD